jgi:hypothetical protein
MLDRRDLLTGGIAVAALAVPGISQLERATAAVNPLSYGARGDGIADDTLAVRKALAFAFRNGLAVDGGTATFGVSDSIAVVGASAPSIKALRLRQLRPRPERKTLQFSQCNSISIESLRIDAGHSRNSGYMNTSGGLWIEGGSNHDVRNVEIFGNGKNSLVGIWNTTRSTYRDFLVHDAQYDAPTARDDLLQGIFMVNNTDCVLQSPAVSNLSGNANRKFPNRFTRGIVLGGNVRVSIVDAKVSDVDQGIDLTGSDGNRDCLVLRAHCLDCTGVGIKLANSAVRCRVMDSVAERCGLMGFLASGPAEAGLPYKTQDCDFVRCTALDSGSNGFSDSAPHAGFRVERNRYDRAYPMGIRLIRCQAIDRQAVRTMDYGFYADVDRSAASRPNQLIDCRSEGHIKGPRFGSWS